MNISELITKLVQFNKTERPVVATIYYRDEVGDVIDKKTIPVETCFSHNELSAEIILNIKVGE